MSCAAWLRVVVFVCMGTAACASGALEARAPTRAQSLAALSHASAAERLAAVRRLGEIGRTADADRLLPLLRDPDAQVRLNATVAMWALWSRSGDRAIDALFQRGIEQFESSQLEDAVATFSDIIRRKPAFAEAWNKRATLYFMLGDFARSMQDCDEVLRRNPNHFGALSGYAQMYLEQGDLERALAYFERAFQVNPNLPGASTTIPLLRQRLQEKKDKTV